MQNNTDYNIEIDTINKILYREEGKEDPIIDLINAIKNSEFKNKILKAYQSAKADGFPFNIEKFATLLNLKILPTAMDNEASGYLSEGHYICVNNTHGELRRRFTIAHELGHYIMHGKNKSRTNIAYYNDIERVEERQANMFARAVLMPVSRIKEIYDINKKYINENRYDIYGRLRDEFKVSSPAILIRLNTLGFIPEN